MELIYSKLAQLTTLTAATELDMLPLSTTGLSAVGGAGDVWDITVTNLDVSNSIDTVTIYQAAAPGGTFAALATTYTIAASGKKRFRLQGYTGVLRITGNSTSGASSSVDVAVYKSGGALTYDLIVDGAKQGSGSAVGNATVGGNLAVTGTTALTGNATAAGTLAVTGDISAAGGFRQSIGPFYITMAADQTAVGLKFGDTANQAWVAPRAGSITAASAMIDTAVTGSSKTSTVKIYKALAASPTSFSAVNTALDLAFTSGGAELAIKATAAKDTYAFAAGDLLKVVYTSTTITSTPKCVASIEIEC